jgi:hypothetical protein
VAGCHAATWVLAATSTECITAKRADGYLSLDADDSPARDVRLSASEPFLDCDVVEVLGLRSGPLRQVVHRLLGRIRETKLRTRCTLGDEEVRQSTSA